MSDENGAIGPGSTERQISDPIVVTLTYTQTLQGPTIRVECDQEIWPDVLADILLRAARFQERELIVERIQNRQMQTMMQAAQVNRVLGRRKN
jgi:hypothetical protein